MEASPLRQTRALLRCGMIMPVLIIHRLSLLAPTYAPLSWGYYSAALRHFCAVYILLTTLSDLGPNFGHPGSGESPWIVAGISGRHCVSHSGNTSTPNLSGVLEEPIDSVLILARRSYAEFLESADLLLKLVLTAQSTLVILVPREAAPTDVDVTSDPDVSSLLCTPGMLKQLIALRPDLSPRDACYELLEAILNGDISDVDHIFVRQIPDTSSGPITAICSDGPTALLMAHRGRRRHLRIALRYLLRCRGVPLRIRVGLDIDTPAAYDNLIQEHPEVDFFRASPSPAGPFVIRQDLATRSPEPLLAFQDSDDLSCTDRFASLSDEMSSTHCDMIGSHELRVDESRRTVTAVRFPLDVSAALKTGPCHALLHATLMITRSAFFSAGGLSTDQIFASDTQFLLRAFFYLKIRNVDKFLYIRRRHRDSLTAAPATAFGSPLRSRLGRQWSADFEKVKCGELKLEDSSLSTSVTSRQFRIERVFPSVNGL